VPHETKLTSLPGVGGLELAAFPFVEIVPCPTVCSQGGDPTQNQHPEKVYIHLEGSLIALASADWCLNDLCIWCWLNPFVPNIIEDPIGDSFKNGIIQMAQVAYHPGSGKCTCEFGSTSACCWCMGGYDGDDDVWELRPSDCDGVAPGNAEEGSLYQGGAFCSEVFDVPLWFVWIGVATCPSPCGQNPFEGCGPECGLIDPAQAPCRCLPLNEFDPGAVSFSVVYVKPNFAEPGTYPQGTMLGRYEKLYANAPDENDFGVAGVGAPDFLTVNTDPTHDVGP